MKIEEFNFALTEIGITQHIKDIEEILNVNVALIEGGRQGMKHSPFYKVISQQLRILLTDNEALFQRVPSKKIEFSPLNKVFVEYHGGTKGVDLNNTFDLNASKLDLESWLDQVIMECVIPLELPSEIRCDKCNNRIRLEDNSSFGGRIYINKLGSVIRFSHDCGKNSSFDFTNYQGDMFNWYTIEYFTIRDVIKIYANKNGGAHVQNSLNYRNFYGAHLGDSYLLVIAKYLLRNVLNNI